MLRIERIDEGTETTTVRATGRLTGPWVAELEKALSEYSDTPLVLDLSDVSFVDRAGIALLRMLKSRGRMNLRCSAFVAEQIN